MNNFVMSFEEKNNRLMDACRKNNLKKIIFLMSDIEFKEHIDYKRLIATACIKGHQEIVEYVLNHFCHNIKNDYLDEIKLVSQHNHVKLLEYFFKQTIEDPSIIVNESFVVACKNNHQHIIEFLVEHYQNELDFNKVINILVLKNNFNLLTFLFKQFPDYQLEHSEQEKIISESLNNNDNKIIKYLFRENHISIDWINDVTLRAIYTENIELLDFLVSNKELSKNSDLYYNNDEFLKKSFEYYNSVEYLMMNTDVSFNKMLDYLNLYIKNCEKKHQDNINSNRFDKYELENFEPLLTLFNKIENYRKLNKDLNQNQAIYIKRMKL